MVLLIFKYLIEYIFFFRFPKLRKLKEFLYSNKERKDFLFQCAVCNFEDRLRKKGSWIGYTATFKDMPVFPHGITGVFVTGGVK